MFEILTIILVTGLTTAGVHSAMMTNRLKYIDELVARGFKVNIDEKN